MLKIVLPIALVTLIVLVAGVAAGIYFYNSSLEHSSIFNNPTSTSVVCVPSTISKGQSTSCAATVTDTSSTKTFVTGNVSFTPTGSCHLAGFGPMETCYVSIQSSTSGALTVTARYAGDSSHTPSSASTIITVDNPSGSSNTSSSCRDPSSISSHVYNPGRLQILNPCITVTGIVDKLLQEADGDYHVRLHLDNQYTNLLDSGNINNQYGDLVVEIICVLPITQQDALPSCQGYTNNITIPSSGQSISVSGPYVYDTMHDWNEIHPVYSLTIT